MHVIAKPVLVDFWCKYPDALPSLTAWYRVIQSNEYANLAELKTHFASADHVRGLTMFNIAGNKYRLIAAIHYNRRKVYVRHILTHSEYDLGKWRLP